MVAHPQRLGGDFLRLLQCDPVTGQKFSWQWPMGNSLRVKMVACDALASAQTKLTLTGSWTGAHDHVDMLADTRARRKRQMHTDLALALANCQPSSQADCFTVPKCVYSRVGQLVFPWPCSSSYEGKRSPTRK